MARDGFRENKARFFPGKLVFSISKTELAYLHTALSYSAVPVPHGLQWARSDKTSAASSKRVVLVECFVRVADDKFENF